jgi:hypothetical protein
MEWAEDSRSHDERSSYQHFCQHSTKEMVRRRSNAAAISCWTRVVLGAAMNAGSLVMARNNDKRGGVRRSAQAAQELIPAFFGENLSSGGKLTNHPSADAARDKLFRFFRNPETEDFESFTLDTRFPFISKKFASVGDTFLSGAQTARVTNVEQFGRYSVSGTKFLDMDANDDFVMQFQNPVVGFGFYAVDVGDNAGTLNIETSLKGGNVKRYTVQHTKGAGVGPAGSDKAVIYSGFIDLDGFDSITFDLVQGTSRNTDFFGFDDFSVFSPTQFVGTELPSSAPSSLPSTLRPTVGKSASPSIGASSSPSIGVSSPPSVAKSASPSVPTSASPSVTASASPSVAPVVATSASPSSVASASPSRAVAIPTVAPTVAPVLPPTVAPAVSPSLSPSSSSSGSPSLEAAIPTLAPTVLFVSAPTVAPTFAPNVAPTVAPSLSPSSSSSGSPSLEAAIPTVAPTVL